MKRRMLLMCVAVLLAGCNSGGGQDGTRVSNSDFTTREIDGCEYIEYNHVDPNDDRHYSLTHKGNCRNPIHRCGAESAPTPKP